MLCVVALTEEAPFQNESIPDENIGFNILGNSWAVDKTYIARMAPAAVIPHTVRYVELTSLHDTNSRKPNVCEDRQVTELAQ